MQKLNFQMREQTAQALGQFKSQLYTEIQRSSLKHWLDDPKVAKNLDEKVHAWAYEAKNNLDQVHPYLNVQQQLEAWYALEQVDVPQFSQMLEQYQQFQQQIGLPDMTDFWQQQIAQLSSTALQLQFRLLQEKWQRKLTEAVAQWEFEQLALQRDTFLQEIKDFLATLQKMSKHSDSLGLDTGIFIDYSKGQLTEQDIYQFQQWTDYLEQDQELFKLCKMIGSAQSSLFKPRRMANRQQYSAEHEQHNLDTQDEMVGIQFAQHLNLALPSELALLADPELQILFDLKYLESNLMSLHMVGDNQQRVIQDQHAPKQALEQGPMVICLDTSGSMHGQPELIAKAMCLYLAMQAMHQRRPIYIINFSTNLTTLDVLQDYALDDLIHFLSQSFHGGTDILPAISHAVEMLEQPNFQFADVVVVSDFIMGQLNDELMEKIQHVKRKGNSFYALAIGNFRFDHLDQGLFDRQWIYQANIRKVVEMKKSEL